MSPKVKALLTKAGISIVFATAIGYMIKGERMIGDRVDEKYGQKKDDETTS